MEKELKNPFGLAMEKLVEGCLDTRVNVFLSQNRFIPEFLGEKENILLSTGVSKKRRS